MTATLLYRIAAIALVLFAAGHTFGFLTFRPSSAEGLAVYGAVRSYSEFYTGFGLLITAYLLFCALVCVLWAAWQLRNAVA